MPASAFPTRLLRASQSLDLLSDAMARSVMRWCAQNSWSSNLSGLRAMADLLEDDFAGLDLGCRRQDLASWESLDDDGQLVQHATGPALLWHHRPQAPRRMLWLIHYDTVYPPQRHPPAITLTSEGRLVGPGVADAKGGIAVILYALQAIVAFDLAGELGITVVLNPDEEIGSPSSASLLETLAPLVDFGLVFEPTLPDGSMVANRKGTGNFSIIITGRAAHAGRNLSQGRNAIIQAARIVQELESWNQMGSQISVNVGKIHGGGPLNQVPHRAIVSVNIRIATAVEAAEVMKRLNELEERYSTFDGFACRVEGGFHCPPKFVDGDRGFTDLRRQVQRAAAKIDRPLRWQDTGGACDGNKLTAFGCSNIDTMGPTGGNLHSPLEYCEAGSLVVAAKTLIHLVADCGSGS